MCCPLLIPVKIAVVAAAPAGRSEPLQSGFGHQAELEVVGPVAESGSGSALPAGVTQELKQNLKAKLDGCLTVDFKRSIFITQIHTLINYLYNSFNFYILFNLSEQLPNINTYLFKIYMVTR